MNNVLEIVAAVRRLQSDVEKLRADFEREVERLKEKTVSVDVMDQERQAQIARAVSKSERMKQYWSNRKKG